MQQFSVEHSGAISLPTVFCHHYPYLLLEHFNHTKEIHLLNRHCHPSQSPCHPLPLWLDPFIYIKLLLCSLFQLGYILKVLSCYHIPWQGYTFCFSANQLMDTHVQLFLSPFLPPFLSSIHFPFPPSPSSMFSEELAMGLTPF